MIALKRSSQVSSLNQDEYIMAILQEARPNIIRLAQKMRIDFDDAYQQAALVLCRVFARGDNQMPQGYYWRAMRLEIIGTYGAIRYSNRVKSVQNTISIDLASGPDHTPLADFLVQPEPAPCDDGRNDPRAKVLYAALRRLHKEEQLEIKDRFHLHDFQPESPQPANWSRSIGSIRSNAFYHLRRDKRLAAILEVRA